MYAVLPYFWSSNDNDEYEKWENQLENFFRYFFLKPEQKCHHTQMKLVEKLISVRRQSYNYRDWLVLQNLHTRYAPHLENPQFSDLVAECKKIVADMKILENKIVEIVEGTESEPEVDDMTESGPEVELVSPQKEIFFRPIEVEEIPV